jgi:hypothetical protein
MKRRISQKVIGIALEADRALMAEVSPAGGKLRLVAAAEFIFPAGIGLDQPAALGQALAQFLRREGFSRRPVVIGLSARNLVTRRCTLPPADMDVALAGLRLQAEGAFSSQANDLVVDYYGTIRGSAPIEGLLVATSRALVEQCRTLMNSARLRLAALTATTPTLAAFSDAAASDGLVVNAAAAGTDIFLRCAGVPAELRYAGARAEGKDAAGLLTADIRRTLLAHRANGSSTNSSSWPVAVWDSAVEHDALGLTLRQRLGLAVSEPKLQDFLLGVTAEMQRFAPAAALALAASTGSLPVDFLHSRLAPPRVKTPRRRIAWAAAIAATLLLAVVAVYYNLHQREVNLTAMQMQLIKIKPEVKQAKIGMTRLTFARNWHSGAPVLLKSFRSLTRAFPDSGSIYATSLNLADNGRGQITGKAGSESQVLELRDRMLKAGGFTSISVRDVRQIGLHGGQYDFTIAFRFNQ